MYGRLVSVGILLACACVPVLQTATVPENSPPPPPAEPAPEPKPTINYAADSRQLFAQMYEQYSGLWFKTLRFTQRNTLYSSTGKEIKSTWEEHISAPGRLRIDFLPLSDKSGILINNDRVVTFTGGKKTSQSRSINPLLLLTVDAYVVPPEVTLRRLDSLGVKRHTFRISEWDGKPVYVIGAEEGDTTAAQLWIDAERLLLVRWIQREPRGKRVIHADTRVSKYKDVAGVPIPFEILVLHDGKPYFKEEYEDVEANVPLSEQLFDPARWATARTVK
jgi:hypothetical protein